MLFIYDCPACGSRITWDDGEQPAACEVCATAITYPDTPPPISADRRVDALVERINRLESLVACLKDAEDAFEDRIVALEALTYPLLLQRERAEMVARRFQEGYREDC